MLYWVSLIMSDCLQPCELQPTRLLCPWGSPGKNTRGGCHFLFQGSSRYGGIKPVSLVSPAGGFFTTSATPFPYSSNLLGLFCYGILAYLVYIPLTYPALGWFWFPTTMIIMKIINILLMKTIKQPISICRNTCNFKILW